MGEDSAYIKGGGLEFESPSYNILTDSVVKKVNQMYETFQTSGGRVQWTGIGNKGFPYLEKALITNFLSTMGFIEKSI